MDIYQDDTHRQMSKRLKIAWKTRDEWEETLGLMFKAQDSCTHMQTRERLGHAIDMLVTEHTKLQEQIEDYYGQLKHYLEMK